MIAQIKMVAKFFGELRLAGGAGESDELIESGIRQFGDGMGLTSVATYPCIVSEEQCSHLGCEA